MTIRYEGASMTYYPHGWTHHQECVWKGFKYEIWNGYYKIVIKSKPIPYVFTCKNFRTNQIEQTESYI